MVYEWAGYLCSWGDRRRKRGCVPGQGQCYGEGSKPLVKATAWASPGLGHSTGFGCFETGAGRGGRRVKQLVMPLGCPAEMSGGCLVPGGCWMSAITFTPGWCQWESPCGLKLPTERPSPPAQGLGKAWRPWNRGRPQAGNNGEPRGNMMNDILSPWPPLSLSLTLSCLRKGCLCCTASMWSSVLHVDHSEPFPPQPRACTPWSSPLCLSTHSCWAPGAGTEQAPCCPQGSWCCMGNLLSSTLTPPPLIPAGPATCPGSQGKDPELACSRLGQARLGTRDRGQALEAGANLQFPRIPQGRT